MKSMTGYGRADGTVAGREVTVEVRCYNHRFKDVRVKLPRGWTALEVPVENLTRGWMGRGRVECVVRAASGATGVGKPNLDLLLHILDSSKHKDFLGSCFQVHHSYKLKHCCPCIYH